MLDCVNHLRRKSLDFLERETADCAQSTFNDDRFGAASARAGLNVIGDLATTDADAKPSRTLDRELRLFAGISIGAGAVEQLFCQRVSFNGHICRLWGYAGKLDPAEEGPHSTRGQFRSPQITYCTVNKF